MSIISYAQNFEDVMLWRALKDIKSGFYIDVGAWSPDLDSVTRLFYENGWQGINIEPNVEFYNQLVNKRPRDTNLRIAVSDSPGVLEMNFLSNPGLSTLDNNIAKKHNAAGCQVKKQQVQVTTLTEIWANYIAANQTIHFLKIDVEGLEKAVLKGNDWKTNRPWIVVVEATLPMTQKESFDEWENILISFEYQFTYADGLNRFYIAKEHSELITAFKYPPNVFDEFILYAQQQVTKNIACAEDRATKAEARSTQLEERLIQREALVKRLDDQLTSIYNSVSWRITGPIRKLKKLLK